MDKVLKRVGGLFYTNKIIVSLLLKVYRLRFVTTVGIREVFCDRIYTRYKDFVPNKKDIVIDVGSQFGDYAILCAKYYKAKTYAFEPLKKNVNVFRKNIKLNDLPRSELMLYPVALGDKNKKMEISFTKEMMHLNKSENRQFTQMRTLDSFDLKPTLMKIDVEGFEMHVLRGGIKTIQKYHPKIIIETHTKKLKKRVLDFLNKLGYDVIHEGRMRDVIQNLFLKADRPVEKL